MIIFQYFYHVQHVLRYIHVTAIFKYIINVAFDEDFSNSCANEASFSPASLSHLINLCLLS